MRRQLRESVRRRLDGGLDVLANVIVRAPKGLSLEKHIDECLEYWDAKTRFGIRPRQIRMEQAIAGGIYAQVNELFGVDGAERQLELLSDTEKILQQSEKAARTRSVGIIMLQGYMAYHNGELQLATDLFEDAQMKYLLEDDDLSGFAVASAKLALVAGDNQQHDFSRQSRELAQYGMRCMDELDAFARQLS